MTPPSTIISNTMSALFRPYCGRAFGSFGIRTLSGRRPICASAAAGRPVSGQTFGFGLGVGVGGTVAVADCVGAAVKKVAQMGPSRPRRATRRRHTS